MTSINFNPATRIGTTPPTPQAKRPAPQETEERVMIARLFGKPLPPADSTAPVKAANNIDSDEFAPSLGRNLDVLA